MSAAEYACSLQAVPGTLMVSSTNLVFSAPGHQPIAYNMSDLCSVEREGTEDIIVMTKREDLCFTRFKARNGAFHFIQSAIRQAQAGNRGGGSGGESGLERQQEAQFDRYVQRTEQLAAQSTQSLSNSERVLLETNKIATETLGELSQQGERLRSTKSTLQKVDEDMTTATWLLRGIESWSGMIWNAFSGPPTPARPEVAQAPKATPTSQAIPDLPPLIVNAPQEQRPRSFRQDDGRLAEHMQAQDQQLDRLSQGVAALKVLSTAIGGELDSQNAQLDEMSTLTEKVQGKMNKNNATMKRIT
jgi:hypothetical protein